MDPHGPTVQRFPLVARFRPPCLPLPERVRGLVELADTAVKKSDQGLASAVYNQAALIASDLSLPDLAREMCHQHAAAYLHACPLSGMSAIRGLEPVVNLARLQIRAGHADEGRQRLLDLYTAVEAGTVAQFEDVAVPADLTATDEDHHEVRAWLWRVLLVDGTRTLTTTGRWAEAKAHIEAHRGVGKRMLDGRQVAVLAALAAGDTAWASVLLADTMPGEPWEQAVTACLTVLCRRDAGQPVDGRLADLVTAYSGRETEPGMTVFDIRLGLTILDSIGSAEAPAAHRIVEDLHRRTTDAQDGYAARENLAHTLFTEIATDRQTQDCRILVRACALGAEAIPNELQGELAAALRASDSVIRASLARPFDPGRTSPMERS
ncbi:hypothetical protein Sipo8835_31810 [Streptomyces ipomoeae]|jgi:hypothetical protein|uniref:Uncharacterized protein n=1 Tax=Streptomyces ipomoeae TaxID=103232 RepID=A0AAE8VY39_9ACTN|nr:hypothetical protein [Streptomyces ipomoeae]MDX2822502.1 hypothetical protein [Streptomyces ipomoeae]MDX2875128.1 hypothetical protein [Streptomyces ipomoeae]TQE25319.1 hypothetical protein Sipo8835_31810 [Streptomyces ipomoeae]TQE26822.1 hypothetical protein Sipo7851_32895 [Streptomyces ipomoeae]